MPSKPLPADVTPVVFTQGQELKPNTVSTKPAKLKPVDRRMKDVHVQSDWFVRQNLVKDDESYEVPQYIMGQSPNGDIGVVANPEYEPIKDKNGTLIELEMSKGPKVGGNGELLPSRYPIRATAPTGDPKSPHEHVTVCIRQDN